MALQGMLGLTGFYQETRSVPPRFPALIGPPLLLITGLLLTQRGRRYIETLRLDRLTLLHVVRIPVEVVLFWLFVGKAVPQVMTFEGRNFDILSGITAPIVYYVGFVKRQLPRNVLLVWNLVCLGLLVNIVLTAALAAPTPFQQIAFEQPNIGILYFPFVWLPSVVVPHCADGARVGLLAIALKWNCHPVRGSRCHVNINGKTNWLKIIGVNCNLRLTETEAVITCNRRVRVNC
jgi:hypothetical protein